MKQKTFKESTFRKLLSSSLISFFLVLVLSGCKDTADPQKDAKEKVLNSTRYLPVEEANLNDSQTRLANIYAAIDSLGKFIAEQKNPELHGFYLEMVSKMNLEVQTLKKKESNAKKNIQAYTFYINQYGSFVKEAELVDE